MRRMETLGARIRRLRRAKKWSQDELGAKTGVRGQSIYRYEKGRQMPGAEALIRIADALEVSIDELVRGSALASSDPPEAA